MELLSLFDCEGNKKEGYIKRGTRPSDAYIMLVVAIIKNKDNKYLVQKTSKEKDNLYALTGGHVNYMEDHLSAIKREIKEELGLDIDNIKELGMVKHPSNMPCLFKVYEVNCDTNNFTIQKEEVESVSYKTYDEIISLINEEQFKKTHAYIFKTFINN